MRYRTIVADPPWRYPGREQRTGVSYSSRGGRDQKIPYPTMELEEIARLPVRSLARLQASLFLWTTNRHLRHAYGIAQRWGFEPIATLVWTKQRGLVNGGTFYSNVEFIIYARRTGTAAPTTRVNTRWFDWPRAEHSRKPEAFLDLVESLCPGPYLELFARRQRLGWDTWGNEAFDHVELSA